MCTIFQSAINIKGDKLRLYIIWQHVPVGGREKMKDEHFKVKLLSTNSGK